MEHSKSMEQEKDTPVHEPWEQNPYFGNEGFPPYPFPGFRKKNKWAAGLLAFFIPGTGHFYLGLMQKGLLMMALIIADIVSIVYFSEMGAVPLILLFSLLMPVIYFYNIFDALQSTDALNERLLFHASSEVGFTRFPGPVAKESANGLIGWLFILFGAVFFLVSKKPDWMVQLFGLIGSYAGAAVLIAIGLFLFLKDKNTR